MIRDTVRLTVFTAAFIIVSVPAGAQAPDNPIPRMPNGRPDMGGVWDHPRTGNLEQPSDECGSPTRGCKHEPGPLSFTELGLATYRDKANHIDWTAVCLPWGYQRAWGTTYPVEFVQTPARLAIMFESNNVYKIVPTDGTPMPESIEPSWWGVSRGHWEGDTMVVETKGFNAKTYLDTAEHPHGEKLEMTERFQMIDKDHLTREVTITDPDYYEKPFKFLDTLARMKPGTELMEYVCMENNRWLERRLGEDISSFLRANH